MIHSYETAYGLDGRYTTRLFDTATGNISTSTDKSGQVTSYSYDNIDRITSVWDSKGNVTSFYKGNDWEGQVSDTKKNGSLISAYSYDIVTAN